MKNNQGFCDCCGWEEEKYYISPGPAMWPFYLLFFFIGAVVMAAFILASFSLCFSELHSFKCLYI